MSASVAIDNLCGKILYSVRSSNLNYACQETPYSIYLTIRKSWSKHQQVQQPQEYVQQLPQPLSQIELNLKDREIENIKCELEDLKTKLQMSKQVEGELRVKVDAAEVKAKHQRQETEKVIARKDEEIDIFKNSIKNIHVDKEKLCSELKSLKKMAKCKDKEIYDLETFKSNNFESLDNVRNEARELKIENKKLKQQVKNLEKKDFDMKVKKVSEENNNKLSVSEEKLFHISDPSMISSVPSSPSSTATMSSSAVSNLTEMLTDHICTHQRQCVLRQPKPPPADK